MAKWKSGDFLFMAKWHTEERKRSEATMSSALSHLLNHSPDLKGVLAPLPSDQISYLAHETMRARNPNEIIKRYDFLRLCMKKREEEN